MSATLHHSPISHRIGSLAGRVWRSIAHPNGRIIRRLTSIGIPFVVARLMFWCIALLILAATTYIAFWVALTLIFVFLVAKAIERMPLDPPPAPEWRAGPLGVGLYDHTGMRIDMYDPNDEN